ncbi:MAG: hypothetical protein GF364_06670 [Candidatus Lokiarchaeota archaeon]|nr:hypothetical protein [Candidatus Lokiarchaeota archaeon]
MAEKEVDKDVLRYFNGQRNQSKNYFAFSAEWIGVTLTILTLLWSFGNYLPAVSYLLLIAFICFVNNVAVNSKIIHEIDDGQLEELGDLSPWVSFAEATYSLGSTLVLTSFMIIFYSALQEDIWAPTIFLVVIWLMLGIYSGIRKKVNYKKRETEVTEVKRKSTSIKIFLYLIEIGFLVLLWLDYLAVLDWISALM